MTAAIALPASAATSTQSFTAPYSAAGGVQSDDCTAGATCSEKATGDANTGAVTASADYSRTTAVDSQETPYAYGYVQQQMRLPQTGAADITFTWAVDSASSSAVATQGLVKAKSYFFATEDSCRSCTVVTAIQTVTEAISTNGVPAISSPTATTYALTVHVTGRKGAVINPYSVGSVYVRASGPCDPTCGTTDARTHAGRGSVSLSAHLQTITVTAVQS
jgi:hypothetical protein